MGISDDLTRLQSENVRLKWIVAQAVQRWSKDGFAMFSMDNPITYAIIVSENSKTRYVEVRTKRVEPNDVSNTDGN